MNLEDMIGDPPLIAILRGLTTPEAPEIGEALFEAGFCCLEVPLNSPTPFLSIATLRMHLGGRAKVGAGTVLTPNEVKEAAAAGAQFIVSPNADPAVIAATRAAGLGSLPGVFTPTEAFTALAGGADALKLFPADASSPQSLKALLAVLPAMTHVLPVGGIETASMAAWRAAGAAGFGIGSAIWSPGRSPEGVERRARSHIAAWRRAVRSEAHA
ncbi:MAG TPA: 2-dehydro-3-deoxy-6-phosphogalactonate aldolase [Caulobacteraceae bacterium]|jgi:2-dehydro-3-deoxyphosphogalactonate aldolase|nr:2-dehydro-3-deoxy-6-phosphogalactonate aldolase [Caulobacteraceae bacterium]